MTNERRTSDEKKSMMIKQSNIKLDLELSRNLMKKEGLIKTRNQSIEKNYICQRFAAR